MEKIWLKSYPPGVPAEINPDAYQSLVEVFLQSCRRHHEHPAFYNMGVTLTYGQLELYTREFASFLQNEWGLKKGDRIGIMLPNLLQYPIAMFGALRAGLIIVNVNPLYTSSELSYQMKDSGATALIVLENFADTVQKALPDLPDLKRILITRVGDLLPWFKAHLIHFVLRHVKKKIPSYHLPLAIFFKEALKRGQDKALQPISIVNSDIAFFAIYWGYHGYFKRGYSYPSQHHCKHSTSRCVV